MGWDSTPRPVHVFLVSFPGQGHVNPLLRLGKSLASKGLLVTFSTSLAFGKQILKANPAAAEPAPVGDGYIRFEFFDDGSAADDPRRFDLESHVLQLERAGRALLPGMFARHADANRPVSCVINNPFFPWVSEVAAENGVPSAMLWVQSAACFSCYYHFTHSLVPFPSDQDPEIDVRIPFLPLLKHDEVPSFLHPTTPYRFLMTAITRQFENLSKPFCVLMDTFDELERGVIRHLSQFVPNIKPVGPLFKTPVATSSAAAVRGDFMAAAEGSVEWLDSKPPSSVVYVSFGSVVHLGRDQVEEIAYGLLNSGLSFLWVIRPPPEASGEEPQVVPEIVLGAAGERGQVVEWAPQEAVLGHAAVACFVTHCGWNSTVEALSSGMVVAAFPQWGDQVTNAKFLVDVIGVGVRMSRGAAENKVVGREEIRECLLEATVGKKAGEMRRRAAELKKAAGEAAAEGGSSHRHLEAFVDEVRRMSVADVTCHSTTPDGSQSAEVEDYV